jgi:hypothetical protein
MSLKEKAWHNLGMIIQMNDDEIKTVEDIENYLKASERITFKMSDKKEVYKWMQNILIKFRYLGLNRRTRGLIKMYVSAMTGYSRAQVTRLIKQYVKSGHIQIKVFNRETFQKKYAHEDIQILAQTDELHNNPNGNALKKTLQRMADVFCDSKFDKIKNISVSHIYNIRKTTTYLRMNQTYQKTKPTVERTLGERAKPQPCGKPGYIRVDTVHQGDKDGVKGAYHINTVDEETQFQIIGSTPLISEQYLIPVLEKLISFYPFIIIEFHSDNGSEFINKVVCKLLNKLLIRLTKSRARKTTDNALVESKNGSIIRKWIGYGFIAKEYAGNINGFYSIFNEYLNFHRPCGFSKQIIDKKGKIKKFYPQSDYRTPYEKLKSIENYQSYLKGTICPVALEALALRYTDNQIAELVQSSLKFMGTEAKLIPDYVTALSFAQ